MKYINYPKYCSKVHYNQTIESVLKNLEDVNGFIALYQMGSVRTPGISDLDLVAVFEDNVIVVSNPLCNLSAIQKYLFAHGVFGIGLGQFRRLHQYLSQFHFNLIGGRAKQYVTIDQAPQELRAQIALEYLVSNYIARTVEKDLGIINVRSLLLSQKAIELDMELLNLTDSKMLACIEVIKNWRSRWFENKPTESEISIFFDVFYHTLHSYLDAILTEVPFYLSDSSETFFSRNIQIKKGKSLGFSVHGFRLPLVYLPTDFAKKIFKITRHYKFLLPYRSSSENDYFAKRKLFLSGLKKYNLQYLPHFMPFTQNINLDD